MALCRLALDREVLGFAEQTLGWFVVGRSILPGKYAQSSAREHVSGRLLFLATYFMGLFVQAAILPANVSISSAQGPGGISLHV
jgi:hypothetical protein